MFKKLISKKLFVTVGAALLDILIAVKILPVEQQATAMIIITALATIYVTVQGAVDKIEKQKKS